MLGVYDSMKKLIDKCDLYFEGHIISKEMLLQNYADFFDYANARAVFQKHSTVIVLIQRLPCREFCPGRYGTLMQCGQYENPGFRQPPD